jgi:hypothetical protein
VKPLSSKPLLGRLTFGYPDGSKAGDFGCYAKLVADFRYAVDVFVGFRGLLTYGPNVFRSDPDPLL